MSLGSRERLFANLTVYETSYPEEAVFITPFLELLQQPRCFFRDHLPGHLTGSAWIVNETGSHALLVHHAKLSKWLQPGGHADGDENIFAVALREAQEETGLKNLCLLTENFFDIDIHTIPARKDFREHLHFDIRFIFQASQHEPLLVSTESNQVAWFALDDILTLAENNFSIARMIKKTKHYFEATSTMPKAITTSQNL
ncbi:MAG: NUDIX hydrolase [Cyclobacteriaceae bacterium]|nr:NUDIX hydrolase [Cyclobacteriaceae bacterium]UYN85962.1 MAG: NUDIX hydrolase [Cyclobacteriaceae bacterium]